jgi:hypothetical protein
MFARERLFIRMSTLCQEWEYLALQLGAEQPFAVPFDRALIQEQKRYHNSFSTFTSNGKGSKDV